jgi:CRP/FNR family transcriptional regulator
MLSDTQQSELLAAYPVLRLLPPRVWQGVAAEGKVISLLAGSEAFDEESPCQSYLMVVSGSVRVVKSVKNGRELLLYRVLPGDNCILTVSCLLGNCTYQARGIVETNLVCVVMPRSIFLEMVEQSPEFRTYIFRFFGERVAHLMEIIEAVTFRKLDRRLAQYLLQNGPVIAVTHQVLAAELGSVREVISRILEDFRAQGMVQLDRGQIQVLDEQALERFLSPG